MKMERHVDNERETWKEKSFKLEKFCFLAQAVNPTHLVFIDACSPI